MKEQLTDAKATHSYRRPELKVYGSVRNLTGGSLGSMNDGTGTQTLRMGGNPPV